MGRKLHFTHCLVGSPRWFWHMVPKWHAEPQPPHLPQLGQSNSSSRPIEEGVDTNRDNIREDYSPAASGNRPSDLGSVKVDRQTTALGHVSPRRFLLSVGVPVPREGDQPYMSNSPGRSPSQQQQPQEMAEQQQLQQEPGSQQRLKDDTSYYGAALGQTGTSTRQELTAWLRVLAIPCRSLYATDSASMMSKATKLIEAAEKVIREKLSGNDRKRGNPFGKAWGCK